MHSQPPEFTIALLVALLLISVVSAADRGNVTWRCRGTVGGWCGPYQLQAPFISKPTPRGSQVCTESEHGVCSGVGNCNHDTGLCECPAGWQGADCSVPLKRPCTTRFRSNPEDPPAGHIDENGRDLDPMAEGFTESRCIGVCDSDIGRCFCDGEKYGRINAPQGSPPGTPPVRKGRPLGNHLCQPNDDGKGGKMPWGQIPWNDVYGPNGWCIADRPTQRCGCLYDGIAGDFCELDTEMYCPNQCSGHGECDLGFCKCHPGWYGTDCARKVAGQPLEAGMHEPGAERHKPWLAQAVVLPPAADVQPETAPMARPLRKRPLIYVYDLPPAYNTRMLQYRVERHQCIFRGWNHMNESERLGGTLYGVEPLIHELMLQSEHRTFDPEEADYFYMPIYSSCFIFPIHCWADGPWWHVPSGPRVMHVTNMMIEARDWVRSQFPWWDRRGGRDHIWLMNHDEGACYAPTEIFNTSIFLTHWGRMDLDHKSNTAFTPDNYTQEYKVPGQPNGWLHLIKGHPCYDPKKDLVIPSLKFFDAFRASRLLGAPRQARNILLFFRGDVGKHRLEWYSRGLRQRLYRLAKERQWAAKYSIKFGTGEDVPGEYSNLLASSRFCAVLPGDGWSARAEDAVLHGCIPVIIMDQVHAVFESILDYTSFSIRVAETDLEKLPDILLAVTPERDKAMRAALRSVWHRFAYTQHKVLRQGLDEYITRNTRHSPHGRRGGYPHADDAWGTILQWLYARLPHTRGWK